MLFTLLGEERGMANADSAANTAAAFSRLRLRVILGLLAIAGILFNAFSHYAGLYVGLWLEPIVREFGSALIVAAVIGGTVDLFFKDEFARDAFVAAFRYVLPAELKEEALRIISYKFLSTESRMVVRLEPIPATDLVRVHISLERTVKNISRETEKIWIGFAVDDWGFAGQKSKIEECSFNTGGGWVHCADEKHDDPVVGKKQDDVEIKSGETYKVVMKGFEIHRDNDALRMFHANPAINPIVELHAPADFKYGCSFGVPSEKINPSKIDAYYRLEGTQFPGQCTYIRWRHEKYQRVAQ